MEKFNCTLLVDDDPISCFIIEKVITAAHLTRYSHIVHNGKEAIDFITENCELVFVPPNCPDLIFLDLNMPVMNGFDFLEAYNALDFQFKSKMKIVVLTSSTNPTDLERLQGYNLAGFLNKPLTVEGLQRIFGEA